eukprot:CAMPEP_0174231294 /NCGR_PEP_ID=MMETSP0417-20130205/1850_1 /TAXON_ID=242541 /ORGANISM="Mayorella sp, Strain BSH-02190019" /LENGTH=685 /DNA_ID=CAMNT_0015309151 /DNA_START=585 /DNA_END=2643 /DNA_ORIENTATION=-
MHAYALNRDQLKQQAFMDYTAYAYQEEGPTGDDPYAYYSYGSAPPPQDASSSSPSSAATTASSHESAPSSRVLAPSSASHATSTSSVSRALRPMQQQQQQKPISAPSRRTSSSQAHSFTGRPQQKRPQHQSARKQSRASETHTQGTLPRNEGNQHTQAVRGIAPASCSSSSSFSSSSSCSDRPSREFDTVSRRSLPNNDDDASLLLRSPYQHQSSGAVSPLATSPTQHFDATAFSASSTTGSSSESLDSASLRGHLSTASPFRSSEDMLLAASPPGSFSFNSSMRSRIQQHRPQSQHDRHSSSTASSSAYLPMTSEQLPYEAVGDDALLVSESRLLPGSTECVLATTLNEHQRQQLQGQPASDGYLESAEASATASYNESGMDDYEAPYDAFGETPPHPGYRDGAALAAKDSLGASAEAFDRRAHLTSAAQSLPWPPPQFATSAAGTTNAPSSLSITSPDHTPTESPRGPRGANSTPRGSHSSPEAPPRAQQLQMSREGNSGAAPSDLRANALRLSVCGVRPTSHQREHRVRYSVIGPQGVAEATAAMAARGRGSDACHRSSSVAMAPPSPIEEEEEEEEEESMQTEYSSRRITLAAAQTWSAHRRLKELDDHGARVRDVGETVPDEGESLDPDHNQAQDDTLKPERSIQCDAHCSKKNDGSHQALWCPHHFKLAGGSHQEERTK